MKKTSIFASVAVMTLLFAGIGAETFAFGWGKSKSDDFDSQNRNRIINAAPAIMGKILSVSGSTFTMEAVQKENGGNAKIVYTVDAANAKIMKAGQPGTIADLAAGDQVRIEGTISGQNVSATIVQDGFGIFRGARKDEMKQDAGKKQGMKKPEIKKGEMMGRAVFGKVVSVSGNTITVSEERPRASSTVPAIIFTVDASNAKIMKASTTTTVSAIGVGENIMVQGKVDGRNVAATVIRVGVMGQGGAKVPGKIEFPNKQFEDNGQPIISGTVSAISGNTLTVASKNVVYTVDASNAAVKTSGKGSSLSAIKIGDSVVVQGTISGTNVAATQIHDAPAPKNGFFGNLFESLFGKMFK